MTIFAIVFGPLVGAAMAYIIFRLGRQDNTLREIEIHVDGRLSDISKELREALDLVHESRESGQPVPLPEENSK